MPLFLHSLSVLLFPAHFGFFHFLSSPLFPSSETMVKDNIYRKPPIYKQHGTVCLFNTLSLVCLGTLCCMSLLTFLVLSQLSLYPLEACTRPTDSVHMPRLGVRSGKHLEFKEIEMIYKI